MPKPLVFIETASQHGFLVLLDLKDPRNKDYPRDWDCVIGANTYERDEVSRDITAIHITPESISKYGIPIDPGRPLQLQISESAKGALEKP